MACSHCGGNAGFDRNRRGPNFLDCDTQFLGCHNPCHRGPKNTAQSESLASQITNFTLQFFGDVVKTEVNGKVVWSLPCSLDVGLPANPRGVTEPLACYLLRLFNDGVVGIPGVQGDPGVNGANGANAWTTTVQAFAQPTLSSPIAQVAVVPDPSLVTDLGIFIDGSGWYQITATDGLGTLFLTLIAPVSNAPAVIPAGTLVIPTGLNGRGVAGPQGFPGPDGDQGIPGPPGPPGTPATGVTQTNGQFFPVGAGDFSTQSLTYVNVVLTGPVTPQFTLPNVGTYLITGFIPQLISGVASISPQISMWSQLWNTTAGSQVQGSETEIFFVGTTGNVKVAPIGLIYTTTSSNNQINLQIKLGTAQGAAAASVLGEAFYNMIFTWVQIA